MVNSGNLLHFAIENGPVEIVSFPINSMVIFHSYVGLQGVTQFKEFPNHYLDGLLYPRNGKVGYYFV